MLTETYRILLIEDNPGDAVWIQEQLAYTRGVRYVVDHRNDLQKGFAYLENSICDIVLLDLGLPDSTGIATVDKFLQRFPDLPVIVLTGTEDVEIGALSVKKGVLDYLVKGYVGNSILAKAIRFSIERKKLMDSMAAANKQWQQVFDILPDPIMLFTSGQQILKVNTAFSQLFLSTDAVYEGKMLGDILTAFSWQKTEPMNVPYSIMYQHPQDAKTWNVQITALPTAKQDDPVLVAIFR